MGINAIHKKLLTCLVVVPAILLVVGCDQLKTLGKSSAKEVLSMYLTKSLNGQKEEAYEYISARDKTIKSLAEYQSDTAVPELVAQISNKTSFSIISVTESGDTASAEVEITIPDVRALMGDLFGLVLGAMFRSEGADNEVEGKLKKQILSTIAEKYPDGNFPTITSRENIQLIKENDEWKVFFDWEAEKARKDEQEKIDALLAEAKELIESNKFAGAITKYESVLSLNNNSPEAKDGLKDVNQKLRDMQEKQKYMPNLDLYEFTAKRYDTYLEKNIPGVKFKIKNKGNRTLSKIEVTAYFKDANDTVIFETEFRPVGRTLFGDGDKLLKPNYIWQLEDGKFYTVKSVPDEWEEGAVFASITDIEFLDE